MREATLMLFRVNPLDLRHAEPHTDRRSGVHRARAELYHGRHVYSERARARFQYAAAQTRLMLK